MFNDAEKKGLLTPGVKTLIEPTSGNMGISMAFMAAVKGYKMVLTMPSYTSLERRMCIRAFGAELILTDPPKRWEELSRRLMTFWNPLQMPLCSNNSQTLPRLRTDLKMVKQQVHSETAGPEIWEDTNGKVDIFVMGIGSGGTISGVGQYLKSQNPDCNIYGVEPAESNNRLNGGKPDIGNSELSKFPSISVFQEKQRKWWDSVITIRILLQQQLISQEDRKDGEQCVNNKRLKLRIVSVEMTNKILL